MAYSTESDKQQPSPAQPANRDGSRPVHAVKVSYAVSWLYFLMIVCLLVAWYFPMKILVTRLLWPPAAHQGIRDSYTFAALAYEGVSRKENEISAAMFKEHLDSLENDGYVPITLEDVRRLMVYNEPVPSKAVLVTFDHGRRSSYFGVKSHLRRAGWNAVMFLWTKPIESSDQASLLWPYVRNMVRSRAWEIGAQSHDGYTPVAANAAGRTGHFMTTPQWLDDEQRFEAPAEFVQRIEKDHKTTRAIIERRVGAEPMAYAYPYGDFGQFQARGAFMRQVNLTQVAQFYDLGFVSGNLPINTRHSDPRRLNRLRVRPEWTGADLVAQLNSAWPQEAPELGGSAEEIASAWIVDWGHMEMEQGRMSLRATDRTTGAKMWLGGSDLARDFYAIIDFRLHEGQLGIYLRASPDEESYVYLGLDARGDALLREKQSGKTHERLDEDNGSDLSIWLRQKHVSMDRFTLASSRTHMERRDTHRLELFIRDRLLYAMIDGQPMFGTHIKLRGDPKPGMFGLSVWDPERGRARVDIANVALRNQHPSLATWNGRALQSPHIVQWIHNNSYQLTQLSPPWISFSPVGHMVRDRWDSEIYNRLSRIYHLDLTPQVRVDEEEWLTRLSPSQLADQAAELNLDGVFVNMALLRNPTPTRVASWLQQAGSALQELGMDLLVQLPPVLERPAAINSILAIAPTLKIVATGTSSLQSTPQGRQLTSVRLAEVPEPDPDDELPIYYEIMALPESSEDQSPQARMASLDQEGRAAFMEGDYERAIGQWAEWQEMEPGNPRPLMLIGDAYLRMDRPAVAVEFYDQSLELDPGQISLALRRVRILDQLGREDEAMAGLNLYARLFPDNVEVLLAQAEWLRKRNRRDEARELVARALRRDPYSMQALTKSIRLAETSAERKAALKTIVDQGRYPEAHYDLGQAVWNHDLLSIPEAYALKELVERIARDTTDERVRMLYENLRARPEPVVEQLATGTLSDSWWVTGGEASAVANRVRLRADRARTEVSARLLGSERLRDVYIEADIRDYRGAFWLYARRTENQMVRFGFDNPDRVHLQIWRDGRAVVNESRSVEMPGNQTRLRLEVRGTGMMGYLNDTPLFDAAVALPSNLWFGWAGFSVFDARRGSASVTLNTLAAGPLPLRAVILPKGPDEEEVDALLTELRDHARYITDLAPQWFAVRPNGEWISQIGTEARIFLLFARYHRMRLMPVVDVPGGTEASVRNLVDHARRHNVDGFILRHAVMPSEQWFEAMREQLAVHPLDILVVVPEPERGQVQIRALGSAVDLYRGSEIPWPVRLKSGTIQDRGFQRTLQDLPADKSAVIAL